MCTPEMTAKVCEALRLGVSWSAAAAHAGVTATTLMDWNARGRDGEQPFADFLEATTRARESAETRAAAIVWNAIDEGDVSAAQWFLERRRSETWGRQDKVAVQVDPSQALGALLKGLHSADD